jgi:hypothetical protein
MNKFEFFQNIQLAENGAVEVVSVSGMTDSTITTPGNQEEFFNQIQLDENGRLKVYVVESTPGTPTPTPTNTATPTITPTITPTPTPTPTPVYYYYNIAPCSGGTGEYNKIRSQTPLTIGIAVTLAALPTCYEVVSVSDSSGIAIGNFTTYIDCIDCLT